MNLSVFLACTFLMISFLCSLNGLDGKRTSYLLNKPQCTEKRQRALELEMAKNAPMGSRTQRSFPETYQQVQSYCRDINRIVTQTENFFKECYEKSIRDYATVLIYTTRRNLRKYCGKKGSRVVKEMLKLAPCANKHIRSNSQPIKCLQQYINQTSQLVNIREDHLKIPHACCYFVEGVKCAEEFLTSVPCMRPHVPTLMDYFRTGTSSITDIMCGEYNDQTDACAKLGRPPKVGATTTPTKKYLTPTSLLIDLMESMSSNFTATPQFTGGF